MPTLLLLAALGLQTSTRISGSVTDATALPLPGAIVELDGRVVAISDDRGAFEVIVPPGTSPRFRVTLDGFEPYESILQPGTSNLNITLVVRRFEDRVRVTARPPQAPVDPVFARQPIDVYRTDPVGSADHFVIGAIRSSHFGAQWRGTCLATFADGYVYIGA